MSLNFIGIAGTLTAALLVSFFVLAQQQERLIMGQIEREARVLFKQVVITRAWIADHGGVFIEKKPGMKPSPYLSENQTIETGGKKYLLKTPAMVTKELSRYSEEQGLYWFHITSIKLTNPENAPDDFERSAIALFERRDAHELFSVEKVNEKPFLRYIAPLYVEEGCLKCHSHQGYRIGDIRGAISITLPIEHTWQEIARSKRDMALAGFLTIFAMAGVLFFMMRHLVLSPMQSMKKSIHDFSSGRYSRGDVLRTGDEFEELSRTFSDMAATIHEYHDSLNDKILAATRDIAETNEKLLEANRLLHEANQRKSDFVARASHELRTPLTSIKGAMDYIAIRMKASSGAPAASPSSVDDLMVFFELIRKNSDRLIRMVNDMLDIERIEIGASELRFCETDLSGLMDEVIAYFSLDAESRGIRLELASVGPIPVCADEDRMRQVLINLFSNAMKFSPDNARIAVRVVRDETSLRVSVCDEGPGIPESERGRIFERFYRIGEKEGSGLGLAVCKSIIEAHGGKIWASANTPAGACITFTLPRKQVYCKIDEL
ncbi:MAG: integral membrane sensor signal transduction histidine kinase [Nitrospirae bacterium]|nr:MAG: integral membrane sensor signal transduction histidine kinase [Nitrospirota bacterium]